jgi:hypothetical protein
MENVCYGKSWFPLRYLTKPLLYLEYLKRLDDDAYVILMDSDTFWAARDIKSIWEKFDCARGEKEILLSTEMSCWIGRYCNEDDLNLWYREKASKSPSYSPFVNSGVLMGKVSAAKKLLVYVTEHKDDYQITRSKKVKIFDDQYAIADYAVRIAPDDVALDYHQQLLASFAIHAPIRASSGWPFACRSRKGHIETGCGDFSVNLLRHNHWKIDRHDCLAYRHVRPGIPLEEEMRTLATDPVIWHGNGVGKRIYIPFADKVTKCNLRRNLNISSLAEYTYDRFGGNMR